MNPNAWSTAVSRILTRSAADVTLTQETKVRASAIASATNKAFHRGWKTVFGKAKATSLKGTSGGVAVSARKGLGIVEHPPPADGYEHRIAGAWVGAVVKGGVHVVSVYLKDSEGMSHEHCDFR